MSEGLLNAIIFQRKTRDWDVWKGNAWYFRASKKKWRERAENLGSTCVKFKYFVKYTEITEKTLVFPHIGQSIKSFQVCKSH